MAKDKKTKSGSKAAAKAAKAAKQEKKASKKDKKVASKNKDVDSDTESVDLDAVLAQYAAEQEKYNAITETIAPAPPNPRTASTLIANPANENELFLFGGEYFNGATAQFYNDLSIYNIKTDTWKLVTSPNSPLPRSGHAWCRAANTKEIYLFGGEFSSPKQGTFYHYNDFWRLDPASREWTRIEAKGKAKTPPARSGHRMVGYKQWILLFGGFQDTSQQTKYLDDVWVYDCTTLEWHCPVLPTGRPKPDARSSFSFLPHEQGAVIYGGYSRVKTAVGGKNQQHQKGKGAKGGSSGGGSGRTILKPKVHEDTWFLRVVPPSAESPTGSLPQVSWEKRKRPANPPSPPRAGATMAFHKGRGIMFGGVHDVEESEEGIDSEFFNTLFVWNIERNRYMPLSLRRPKTGAKKANPGNEKAMNRRDRGKANEEELLANLKALEMRAGLGVAEESEDEKEPEEEEDEEPAIEKPVLFEFPHPRFNAQLTVQSDVLYIYGGTFEKGDREFTFDEMFAIDLGKLEGVKEIFRRELPDWQGEESEDEEEDEDEDEDDEGSDEEDEERSEISTAPTSVLSTPSLAPSKPEEPIQTEDIISALAETDTLPHPRPFESLRDFYARTSVVWQDIIIDEFARKPKSAMEKDRSPKEIKKAAFERAEEKWWDCREEIRELEEEQERSGIGEVVSLGEKAGAGEGGAGGGVGRRR